MLQAGLGLTNNIFIENNTTNLEEVTIFKIIDTVIIKGTGGIIMSKDHSDLISIRTQWRIDFLEGQLILRVFNITNIMMAAKNHLKVIEKVIA